MRTRLREMLPSDVPVVEERLREQNERDGTSYGLPKIFDEHGIRLPNIPLALVAVDTETNEVIQAHLWEQTVEQTSYGISSRATLCSMEEFDAIVFLLRARGYRDMHTLVPAEVAPKLEHGFDKHCHMSATGLTHFYRLLDPEENEEVRQFYQKRRDAAMNEEEKLDEVTA